MDIEDIDVIGALDITEFLGNPDPERKKTRGIPKKRTEQDITQLLKVNVNNEHTELVRLKRILELKKFEEKLLCEQSLAQFVRSAWHIIEPGTVLHWNWHLDTICGYLMAFHRRELPDRRLIINIPPGTLKSILVSVMYPAWTWIDRPEERFLTISCEQGLAIRDSLRMKQIITSEWFQSKWPLSMQSDQNEKTLYANEKRGFRQAQGITASNTGKRGDVLLLDDLIDAKHAFSDVIRQSVNDTWDQALNSRLNDPVKSGVLLIMQRLHEQDITGHLLKKVKSKWTHLSIPMRYENYPAFDAGKDIGRPDLNDPRSIKGQLLFPQRFTEASVQASEEDLGEFGTSGQLQQRPSPATGGILKKHWWRTWPDDVKLPKFNHVFISFDTAFSEADSKIAAYSAMTRWGIFWHEQRDRYCIMCIGMWFDRVGYDELRKFTQEQDKKHDPDAILIEKKATGITLIQDMKRAVPGKIRSYSPGRGEDKISRAHSVSPMLESGQVYIPNKEWAQGNGKDKLGLIDYCGSFPNGAPPCKDLTDTCTQALIYMRAGHWAGEHDDDKDDLPACFERVLSDAEQEDLDDAQDTRIIYYG